MSKRVDDSAIHVLRTVPGGTLVATSGTAFAEVRSAGILRAADVAHVDPFRWLDLGAASLAALSKPDSVVLATRGLATLRDIALATPTALDGLAPRLLQAVSYARSVMRAAAERHGISLVR